MHFALFENHWPILLNHQIDYSLSNHHLKIHRYYQHDYHLRCGTGARYHFLFLTIHLNKHVVDMVLRQ